MAVPYYRYLNTLLPVPLSFRKSMVVLEEHTVRIEKRKPDDKLGILLKQIGNTICVVGLTPGGLGEACGELQVDDKLLSVNGILVGSDDQAIDIVRKSNDVVILRLLREQISHQQPMKPTAPLSPKSNSIPKPTDKIAASSVRDSDKMDANSRAAQPEPFPGVPLKNACAAIFRRALEGCLCAYDFCRGDRTTR